MQKFKIKIDLYDKTVHVFANCSYKQVLKELRKIDPEIEDDSKTYKLCQGVADLIEPTEKNPESYFWIWIRKFTKGNHTHIDTVIHESFHTTIKIMEYTGHELCEGSEESYAYLNGFLASRILKELNRRKK